MPLNTYTLSNSKSEYRNPKQIQSTNIQMTETKNRLQTKLAGFWSL
jgi:hypothetical protein